MLRIVRREVGRGGVRGSSLSYAFERRRCGDISEGRLERLSMRLHPWDADVGWRRGLR